MFVKKALTIVVILTCWTDITSVALPHSQKNRETLVENERSFKDVSPGGGRASERKPNGNPSRQVRPNGSPRSAAHGLGTGTGEKKLGRRSSRRDVFVDFYEAKNDKHASYRRDDSMVDVEDDQCSQDNEAWSVDSDLMQHLTSILLTGKLGQNNERSYKSSLVSGHNFARTLVPVTRQGTFLEIGTGVTSLQLAGEKMQSLITTLIIPEPPHEKLVQLSKSYDAFVGSVSSKNIKSLVKSLVQDPEVFFGSILLSNLTALFGDNLPHEFEKLLGLVILLAKETYITAPSEDKYTVSYMHSWRTVQTLAERACSSLDMTCAISVMTKDSWDVPSLTKVTLIEGQRPLTRQSCCGDTLEDCSMTYRTVNGTEEVSVGASPHREVRFQRTGLLLSTLLKLNLVGSSLERLIVPLLEMEYNTERLARNILVTNKQFMMHSELPGCQSKIYEKEKSQQERDISDILNGEKEKSAETIDRKTLVKDNQRNENRNVNPAKDASNVKGQRNSVLQSQRSKDQNLVTNTHTEYANRDSASQNMHTVYANDGSNLHNEYADRDGEKNRLRNGKETQKLRFQGGEKRQSMDGVRSQSAIKNNQGAFKSAGELLESKKGKKDFADTNMNTVGLQSELNYADTNMNNMGLQKGLNQADMNMNNAGLQNGLNHADMNMNNMGLQKGLNQADMNMNNVGLADGGDMMHWRKRNSAGWHGDEEGDERQRDRVLEWERAREEMDGYRGAGQGMMKSQVDMVADLWQRENEDVPDAKKIPEVPGSNWDRETDSRSSHDQSASKLVAVGNLLLTRDEDNPTVLQGSWETMKGAKRREDQTRTDIDDEGVVRPGIDKKLGNRGVSGKHRKGGEEVGSRNGAEERHSEGRSNIQGRQALEPPGGGAEGGITSKAAPVDDKHAADRLPAKDNGKTSRGGRFLKQRRKQFRQAAESNKGDDMKNGDNTLYSTQPLTPSQRITARRATETGGGGGGGEDRDGKSKVIEEPHNQERKLLQYYDDDFAYNAEGKMRSDAIKEPIEIQQELEARRNMIESAARQQEEVEFANWEELASAIEEEIPDSNAGDDYYHDGSKVEAEDKEKPQYGKVEDYHDNKNAVLQQDTIEDGEDEDDGWRGDAFHSKQLGADAFHSKQLGTDDGDDDDDDAKEEEEDEVDDEEEIGRMMKEMLKLKETEGEKIFDSMWQVLETVFLEEESYVFSLLTYGGKELSLLSAKVSRLFPNASIVTVLPAKNDQLITSHRKLQNSLQLTNNIVTQGELSDRIVLNLYQQMEYFRFQVLGLATFQKLVTYGAFFPSFLGHLLALSQTTFIEVPHPVTLAALQVLLHSKGKDTSRDAIFKGFLSASLEEAGVLDYSITVLNKVSLQNHARLVRVDIYAFNRQVMMDCSGSLAWFKQDSSKPVSLAPLRSAAAGDFPIQKMGGAIRLLSLLSLGLRSNERKLLFRQYLKLAVHSDMCPMTILWQRGRLIYSPIIDSNIENPEQHIPYADDRKALVETMTKQLERRPFSFMEYGTGEDGLSVTLATKYPNSTFILVTGSEKEAQSRQDELDRRSIDNAVITSMGADASFTSNLVSSPDFMRYQYIGLSQLFSMMTGDQRVLLKSMFGDIVATGVTTFFQMPSAQMLSLAVFTFYPEVLCDIDNNEKMDSFQARNHPLHVFKNYELRLLKENIELQMGQVNLSASMVHPPPNPDGSQRGWSMVRIDLRQLNILVDHHFMYVLDGHTRKYSLHLNSNATDYEVYLVRAHDGFKIPYEEVKGISLIALLRMGLLPKIKDNFYTQFLQLPLYGDMAPWNILFTGGKLEYIDYDTKQMTLDKVAPAAYQIMAMLMNYKRTVKDFGHCTFNGRNPYDIGLISHCVGSSYDGPCTDERFPVACADQSCRSTYIDCLRALSEIEQKHSGVKAVGGSVESNTRRDQETASQKHNTDLGERLELSLKGRSRTGSMEY